VFDGIHLLNGVSQPFFYGGTPTTVFISPGTLLMKTIKAMKQRVLWQSKESKPVLPTAGKKHVLKDISILRGVLKLLCTYLFYNFPQNPGWETQLYTSYVMHFEDMRASTLNELSHTLSKCKCETIPEQL
jgi:hypothetical protein